MKEQPETVIEMDDLTLNDNDIDFLAQLFAPLVLNPTQEEANI